MLRRKCKYDIKCLFDKMNLTSVYNDKKINADLINDGKYYVYLIRNETLDNYYVGSSINLKSRIKDHLKRDKLNIKNTNCIIYILEELEERSQMLEMEKLWICWVSVNANINICDNISMRNCMYLINGKFNHTNLRLTNYENLTNRNIIYGLTLYDTKQYISSLDYYHQERKKIQDQEEIIKNEIRRKGGY
jgi:predicted GIY-YIG superfamily endonuclease